MGVSSFPSVEMKLTDNQLTFHESVGIYHQTPDCHLLNLHRTGHYRKILMKCPTCFQDGVLQLIVNDISKALKELHIGD